MKKGEIGFYKELVNARVQEILKLTGLSIEGMAEFINISPSHMYGINNGNRALASDLAERMGASINISGGRVLQLEKKLPKIVRRSESLNNFYAKNKLILSYFLHTKRERKSSHFIETELYNSALLDKPAYVWEINQYCKELGKEYSSKKLSQILTYMVATGKLEKDKRPLKLRNGKYGARTTFVYYKPANKKSSH